jgi:hypothetical protein
VKPAKTKSAKVAPMRRTIIIGCGAFALAYTHAADAKPVWKAVPNHKGVFVDMASIVHIDVSGVPYRHCVAGGPPDSCDMPPADTKADVKVDGAIANAIRFYCKNSAVSVGDLHFGTVGGKEHIIPIAATKLIVCGPPK